MYNQYAQSQGWDTVYYCEYQEGQASLSWYGEMYDYDFQTGSSANGRMIGHFTQLVWKSTTQVGFGWAKYRNGDYEYDFVVAQYSPYGNYRGQYVANVMPLKPGANPPPRPS